MTSKLNLLTAFLILAIITIKECQASSSTTINSRYTNNNFSNNNELDKYGIVNEVNIIKSPSTTTNSNHPIGTNGKEEEEYVTSFYKRVRNKHRCNLFGKVLKECSSNHGSGSGGRGVGRSGSSGRSVSGMVDDEHKKSVQSSGYDGIDHSLDHYFDHELRTSSSSTPSSSSTTQDGSRAALGYGQQQQKYTNSASVDLTPYSSSSSSSRAQAVRGGGATRSMVHKPRTFVSKVHASDLDELDMDCHADTTSGSRSSRSETIWAPPRSSGRSHSQKGRHSSRSTHHSVEFDNGEYDSSPPNLEDDIQDILDGVVVEDEEVHSTSGSVGLDEHHHLGLLRVPCSIAVNSGEATHHASSHAKTSMATYVDTGAQVTIISASAAKRAGIYHLMDRRYAGRATGVGQCRILGRIPARHVYFLLGEGRCDEGKDQEYDDEDWYPRGGDQDDVSTNGRGVQMDGPALTVLEGTVTQGVDILLGLDVLQDWDAEIRMGGKQKSITVHKRESSGSGVVIPFASSSIDLQRRRHRSSDTRHSHSRPTHRRHHHHMNSVDEEYYPEDQDDCILTSSASDIESDLDLLDQSGHEFPSEDIYISSRSSRISNKKIDELPNDDASSDTGSNIEDDENDDYLQYVDEEEDGIVGEIDMAGL